MHHRLLPDRQSLQMVIDLWQFGEGMENKKTVCTVYCRNILHSDVTIINIKSKKEFEYTLQRPDVL